MILTLFIPSIFKSKNTDNILCCGGHNESTEIDAILKACWYIIEALMEGSQIHSKWLLLQDDSIQSITILRRLLTIHILYVFQGVSRSVCQAEAMLTAKAANVTFGSCQGQE